MGWTLTALLLACVLVPAFWGWLIDFAFRGLNLARYFPLRELQPPTPAKQPWDYQI